MVDGSETPATPEPDDAAPDDAAAAGSSPDPATPPGQSPEKDPGDWVTGEEPATGPQLSYLRTLAQEADEDVPAELSKADASRRIDELQQRTGRGGS